MAGSPFQPLSNNTKIVNEDGTPTDYFIRLMQIKGLDLEGAASQSEVDALSDEIDNLAFDDLADVDMTTTPPADGEVPTWSAADSLWLPGEGGGGGGGGPAIEAICRVGMSGGAASGATDFTVDIPFPFDEFLVDELGMGTDPEVLVVPSDGWYHLDVIAGIENYSDASARWFLYTSVGTGTAPDIALSIRQNVVTNGVYNEMSGTAIVYLYAGNTIKLRCLATSDTSANASGFSVLTVSKLAEGVGNSSDLAIQGTWTGTGSGAAVITLPEACSMVWVTSQDAGLTGWVGGMAVANNVYQPRMALDAADYAGTAAWTPQLNLSSDGLTLTGTGTGGSGLNTSGVQYYYFGLKKNALIPSSGEAWPTGWIEGQTSVSAGAIVDIVSGVAMTTGDMIEIEAYIPHTQSGFNTLYMYDTSVGFNDRYQIENNGSTGATYLARAAGGATATLSSVSGAQRKTDVPVRMELNFKLSSGGQRVSGRWGDTLFQEISDNGWVIATGAPCTIAVLSASGGTVYWRYRVI